MRAVYLILFAIGLSSCSPPSVSNAQKCTQTVHDYAKFRDDPETGAQYGALFTEAGIFELGGNEIAGRDALIERHEAANQVAVWNHVMDDIDIRDDLIGNSRVIVYTHPKGGDKNVVSRVIIADYSDRFEMVKGSCLIAERRVAVVYDSSPN